MAERGFLAEVVVIPRALFLHLPLLVILDLRLIGRVAGPVLPAWIEHHRRPPFGWP